MEYKDGICATKNPCVLSFRAGREDCWLDFGSNAKFEYRDLGDEYVALSRKNIGITIPKDSFIKLFKVINNK